MESDDFLFRKNIQNAKNVYFAVLYILFIFMSYFRLLKRFKD